MHLDRYLLKWAIYNNNFIHWDYKKSLETVIKVFHHDIDYRITLYQHHYSSTQILVMNTNEFRSPLKWTIYNNNLINWEMIKLQVNYVPIANELYVDVKYWEVEESITLYRSGRKCDTDSRNGYQWIWIAIF